MDYYNTINEDHFSNLDELEKEILLHLSKENSLSLHPSVWSEEDIELFRLTVKSTIAKTPEL